VPVSFLPPAVVAVAQWTPMYPVVALVQQGWGTAAWDGLAPSAALGDLTQPLLCLGLWLVVAALAAKRWMRWEPRR
jgi:ABC-2 type transport system permease protein